MEQLSKAQLLLTLKAHVMLLRHLLLERHVQEFRTNRKTQQIVEDAGVMLKAASAVIKSGTGKLDLDALADTITAIKLLTNKDNRQAITKADLDLDVNVNSAKELADMLNKVPSSATTEQPKAVRDFMRAVASFSKSTRKVEFDKLKAAFNDNKNRENVADELATFAGKLVVAIQKLKSQIKPA